MPSSLATVRARLQIVLDDAGADFWTTAELDAHIQRALEDLSHHIPQEKKGTVATSSGSRDVDISALTKRVRVVAVEYPIDQWPRSYVSFSLWIDVLTIHNDPIPDGSNCYVYYHTLHTINGTDTLTEDHDETLIFGAAARACDQQAADVTNQVTTGGPATQRNWSGLARHFRHRYDERLQPRRGIKVRGSFAPSEPLPSQDSDPGP